jgi:Domain of unknown function (DUF4868)
VTVPPVDRWFKGNTHTHTTNSDGDAPPEPLQSDPDRPLRPGEWYRSTPEALGFRAIVQALRQPQNLQILNLADLTERDPSWYAFVARSSSTNWAAFIRRSSRLVVARRQGRAALFREQTVSLVSPDSRALYFDERFDLVVREDRVLVADTGVLDSLFTDRAQLQARVPQHVSELVSQGLVLANPDEWIAACQRNLYMMRKLARITESGYVAQITPKKVAKLLKDFSVTGKGWRMASSYLMRTTVGCCSKYLTKTSSILN